MSFFEEKVKYVKICHQNSQNMKEYVKSPKICKKHIFLCIYKKCRALIMSKCNVLSPKELPYFVAKKPKLEKVGSGSILHSEGMAKIASFKVLKCSGNS